MAIDSTDFAGLKLSVDEAALMIERAELQWRSIDANSRALEVDDGFVESRIRFDMDERRFILEVLSERDSTRTREVYLDAMTGVHRDRVSFISAPRRIAEVQQDGAKVAELLAEKSVVGASYWLDCWTGTVGVAAENPQTIQVLQSELTSRGVAIGARLITSNQSSTWKSDAQVYNSVFAGLKISSGSSYCTSGFGVSTAYGDMLLTAGHCFLLGASTSQGGIALGQVVARNYRIYYCCDEGTFDAEVIASSASSRATFGRIHLNDVDWAHRITGWIGLNSDTVGSIICHSGVTTAGLNGYLNQSEQCGPITQRNYSPSGYMYQPSPVYRISTAQSRSGDSGGGFYFDSIYGSLGVGLMSGRRCSGSDCAGDSIISHLPFIMNYWGITPLTN